MTFDLFVPVSFLTELVEPFLLDLDEVVRAGTGLSLLEEDLESVRDFSPLVDELDSLLDLRFLRSLGMSAGGSEPELWLTHRTRRFVIPM